jgi:catechol 2,3-dioxygenase-like lactoylglutathione lyase family enzyme
MNIPGGSPPLVWQNGGSIFDQVGIVVSDLKAALTYFTDSLGIGPWRVYTHGPGLAKAVFQGQPGDWLVWLALSPWDTRPQLELVQPISGDSVHHRFLAEHGEGVQHFGIVPADYDSACRRLVEQGFPCVQEAAGYGDSRDGRNAYFDTRSRLFGSMLELMGPPTLRPKPLIEWASAERSAKNWPQP